MLRLTNHPAEDFLPAWSPDGRFIAFTSYRDGNAEIYVMNADGSNLIRLTNDVADDHFTAWSPDGTQIAFCSERDSNAELDVFLMAVDGSNPINLTGDSPADDCEPDWHGNGNQLLFTSGRSPSDDIYLMNMDGSNVIRLTHTQGINAWPRWRPQN